MEKLIPIRKLLYNYKMVKQLTFMLIRNKKNKMPVRKLKPVTPGQRFRIVNEFSELTLSLKSH